MRSKKLVVRNKLPTEIFLTSPPLNERQITNLENLLKGNWGAFKIASVLSAEDLTTSILKSSVVLSDFQLTNFRYFYGIKNSNEEPLLAPNEILALDENQALNLKDYYILDLTKKGYLTLERAKALTAQERDILSTWWIANLIRPSSTRPSILTVEKAFKLTEDQRNFIFERGYYDLLKDRRLPLEIVLLIHAGRLTHDQAIRLNSIQKDLLAVEYSRLITGEVTLAQLGITFITMRTQPSKTLMNDTQSTHTTTVNKSVSESAEKLHTLYKEQIEGEKLDLIIQEMTKWITEEKSSEQEISKKTATQEMADWLNPFLTEDNTKEQKAASNQAEFIRTAAVSAIVRLTAEDYTFEDKRSKTSTKQLLTLIWCGIHDETEKGRDKTVSAATARSKFMQALYEVQRGYNLHYEDKDEYIDSGGPDKFICCGGTFNKLVQGIQTVHPCVSIIFKTKTIAAEKLQTVVKEEVEKYLKNRCEQAKIPDEIEEVRQLLERIETDGCSAEIKKSDVKTIFEAVREPIRARMEEEFGGIYEKKSEFDDLIIGGADTDLSKIPCQTYIEKLKKLLPSSNQPDLSDQTSTFTPLQEMHKGSSSVSSTDAADPASPHLFLDIKESKRVTVTTPVSPSTWSRAPSAEFFHLHLPLILNPQQKKAKSLYILIFQQVKSKIIKRNAWNDQPSICSC